MTAQSMFLWECAIFLILLNPCSCEMKMHFNSWITQAYTQGIGKTRGFSPRHDDILLFTKHPSNFVFNLRKLVEEGQYALVEQLNLAISR